MSAFLYDIILFVRRALLVWRKQAYWLVLQVLNYLICMYGSREDEEYTEMKIYRADEMQVHPYKEGV